MFRNRTIFPIRSLSLLCLCAANVSAADPPTADVTSERATLEAQYAFRVEVVSAAELDPVVFTEIVPFTAEEPAVRLPPDQDLD